MDTDPMIMTVSINLPDDVARSLQDAVETDGYADISDVIREALYTWLQNRTPLVPDDARLRALWQEGLASGAGRASSADDIISEARRRRAI